MRRAHLVIAGTVAGTAAVLAFSLDSTHAALVLGSGASGAVSPTTSPNPSSSSAATSAPASSSPSTTPPTTTSPPTTPSGTKSATGADEAFRYGQLAVTVTVSGGKITHVGIATISEPDSRSESIDSYAVPQLEQQVVEADSAQIDGVSGATYTSDAFVESLTSALDKLGFK